MNKDQRREVSQKFVRKLKRIEQAFIKPIYDALMWQVREFTHSLRTHGSEEAKRHIDKILINDELSKVITNLFTTLATYSYYDTKRSILKSVKQEQKAFGFGFDPELYARLIAYLRLYLLSKAVLPITQTTKELLLKALEIGLREGKSSEVIAREIEDAQMTLNRARMIARTEAQFALFYGQNQAEEDSDWVTQNEWITAEDDRVRESHMQVDGVVKLYGKRFPVPIYFRGIIIGYDFMLGPGDPVATAGNVINCRCRRVTTAARDKNGRLIRKSNISVILPEEVFQPHTVITI
jgi:uncharacterized protein with gpF-like domain